MKLPKTQKEATDNSFRFSVVMPASMCEKVEVLKAASGCSTNNAMFVAILAMIEPAEAARLYKSALALGFVKPRNMKDPEKDALLKRVSGLSNAEIVEMLDKRHD